MDPRKAVIKTARMMFGETTNVMRGVDNLKSVGLLIRR
jgi:hypothetical protein